MKCHKCGSTEHLQRNCPQNAGTPPTMLTWEQPPNYFAGLQLDGSGGVAVPEATSVPMQAWTGDTDLPYGHSSASGEHVSLAFPTWSNGDDPQYTSGQGWQEPWHDGNDPWQQGQAPHSHWSTGRGWESQPPPRPWAPTLPEPEGPIKDAISPFSIKKEIPFKTSRVPYFARTSLTSRCGKSFLQILAEHTQRK